MTDGFTQYTGPAPSPAARAAAMRGQGHRAGPLAGNKDADLIAGTSVGNVLNAQQTAAMQAEPMVRRWDDSPMTGNLWWYPHAAKTPPAKGTTTATLSDYTTEFFDKWEDPNFQTWMISRGIASGRTTAKSLTEDYLQLWEDIGKIAAGGTWRGTPEQYLEYIASGRRLAADEVAKGIREGTEVIDPMTGLPVVPGGAEVNPISTVRSVTKQSLSKASADAAVDRMAQALLGRMASPKEMAKARAAMNAVLAANPTVETSTRDETDPNNVSITNTTKQGASPADVQAQYEMKMQRSSEGMAYGVGSMFERALELMGD